MVLDSEQLLYKTLQEIELASPFLRRVNFKLRVHCVSYIM